MRATIVSLSYQSAARERVTPERVHLIAGNGIDGDRKAGHHPKRHLNIMSHDVVSRLTVDGIAVQPGQLGEQIIVAGIDLAALPTGTRLHLGESALIEITTARTGCSRYGQVEADAEDEMPLGIMARVLESGTLGVGDAVTVEHADKDIVSEESLEARRSPDAAQGMINTVTLEYLSGKGKGRRKSLYFPLTPFPYP